MNAGKYNKKITFCRQDDEGEVNSLGKTEQGLTVIKKVWASVKPTVMTETYEMERLNNTITYDIRVRFLPCLNSAENIIIYKNERYEIKSVVDVRGEGRELAITAQKILKAGNKRGSCFEI